MSSSGLERGGQFDEGVPCDAGGTDGAVREFGFLCDTSQAEGENGREGVVRVHLVVSERSERAAEECRGGSCKAVMRDAKVVL